MKQQELYINSRPGSQPDGTYPHGKNGVQSDVANSVFNEPGFTKMSAIIPYDYIGVIETPKYPVIFSTDNTNSAIGYFNTDTGAYNPIIDDNPSNLVNWPATGERIDLKLTHYVNGESQLNYKGEVVIAFHDKRSFIKYLNCDTPSINKLDDIRFFPVNLPPTITLKESSGGILEAGTYYAVISYEKNDGTITQRSEVSNGITIAPDPLGLSSNKAIEVEISNVDTDYDFVRIYIASKIKGKTTAVEMIDPVPVTGSTLNFLFTGDNLTQDIDITQLLVNPINYTNAQTMGQLNDALYIADLEQEPEINDMQPYTNLITLRWESALMNALTPTPEHLTGQRRGLMHEEVYAWYIQYRKVRGGFTKAYTIPGPASIPADVAASTEASTGGYGSTVKKYKVEDTIRNVIGPTGDFGIWLNDTEVYPNTADYNSITLGGSDLRNTPVRHHKCPSVRWCKQNLYASNNDYGRTQLDLLGVKPANITIPSKYIGIIDGYRLLYAKRNSSNMTVYGQGLLMHGACDVPGAGQPTGTADIYTSGGNWSASVWHQGKGDYNDDWELIQLRQDTLRFHSFDILFNKPSISPTFISSQLKVRRENLRSEGYLEDGADNDTEQPTSHLVDYTRGVNPYAPAAGRYLRATENGVYLTNGISANHFINSRHENCYAATLKGTNWPLSYGDSGIRIRGQSYTEAEVGSPGFEESYLVNLIALKTDIYSNFYSQRLATAGSSRALADLSTIWGGDTFVCDYTFHTYGRHDSIDTRGGGNQGIKVIRRFICESVSNINLRYEIPGNEYSKWYPRTNVSGNNPSQCYITTHDRSKDPNQFGYTRDLNAVNDFISSSIFNPFIEEITKFPHRIHRTGKLSRQNKFRSWRSILPLDYYELQKNMGRIINVEGLYDRLLIHCENALFRTQDKAKLDAGILSVTLGTGDIFQFEPQEAKPAKLGYAGTQHELSCVKTPAGYVFADSKQGEIFLLNDELININLGLNNFLRDNLGTGITTNPFTGKGITIGYDQRFKRLLVTVKNDTSSFTLSYNLHKKAWAFVHDYIPDFYFHIREQLYTLYNNEVYKHNSGPAGVYYQGVGQPPLSFFIDVIFNAEKEILLETIQWISDFIQDGTNQPFNTLTHISVWDSHQHSGRIPITGKALFKQDITRKTSGEWLFNDFRNILKNKGVAFLDSFFEDYALLTIQADAGMAWYKKELLQDTWFCVRFEFDNVVDGTLFINQVNIAATEAAR